MQAYSDPKRENDPHTREWLETALDDDVKTSDVLGEQGWYWWSCFPGCLPDGDPIGPFNTEAEALADAQEGMKE